MNIASSTKFPNPGKRADASSSSLGTQRGGQPAKEQWTVGDTTYNTTESFLKDSGDLDFAQVTYKCQHHQGTGSRSAGNRALWGVSKGIKGAAEGAFMGCGFGAFVAVPVAAALQGSLTFETSMMAMGGAMAAGGALGLLLGATSGATGPEFVKLSEFQGTVQKAGDEAKFFVDSNTTSAVDIKANTPEWLFNDYQFTDSDKGRWTQDKLNS